MLGPQERQPLVELTVFVIGNQVHGPDRDKSLLELRHPLANRRELALGVEMREQRRGVHAVDAPCLLPELFASHPALGRADVDLVSGGHQPPQLALGAARLLLDRTQLGGDPVVVLARQPRLGVGAIALHRDLASRDVGPLALLGEPRAPLDELRPALLGLRQTLGQVALDLVDA